MNTSPTPKAFQTANSLKLLLNQNGLLCQGNAHKMEFGIFHTPMNLNCMELIFNTSASTSGIYILSLLSRTLRIKQVIYGTQRHHPSLKENILWPGSLKGTGINNCLQLSFSLIFRRQKVYIRTCCFRQSILENHLKLFSFSLEDNWTFDRCSRVSLQFSLFFFYFFFFFSRGDKGPSVKAAFPWSGRNLTGHIIKVLPMVFTPCPNMTGIVSILSEQLSLILPLYLCKNSP